MDILDERLIMCLRGKPILLVREGFPEAFLAIHKYLQGRLEVPGLCSSLRRITARAIRASRNLKPSLSRW
jgi:hypothetical protein